MLAYVQLYPLRRLDPSIPDVPGRFALAGHWGASTGGTVQQWMYGFDGGYVPVPEETVTINDPVAPNLQGMRVAGYRDGVYLVPTRIIFADA